MCAGHIINPLDAHQLTFDLMQCFELYFVTIIIIIITIIIMRISIISVIIMVNVIVTVITYTTAILDVR
jgi:hypothetical protein